MSGHVLAGRANWEIYPETEIAQMHRITYRAETWGGSVRTNETSLPEAVEAIAVIVGLDPEACVTRQIGGGEWHVYASRDRLNDDGDGILWFARVVIDVS